MNKKSKHTKRLGVIDIFYDNKLRNQQKKPGTKQNGQQQN